ncbi:MAG: AzlD domain-containing protein [Treponema sp.]|jgi:branched-subunit amino acid transport protein AzlD|nr:AzlD domain-containing protein [Treponema sp.]
MGVVILFCRAFPFLFFREKNRAAGDALDAGTDKAEGGRRKTRALLNFVERIVPPAAMTVLAFNSLAGAVREDLHRNLPIFAAAAFTALVHVWKRNSLISIFGGTALYMILQRII